MAVIPKAKPNFHSTAGNPRIAIAKRPPKVQATGTTTTTSTSTPYSDPYAGKDASSTPGMTQGVAPTQDATFKTSYDFVPTNYQANPLYNWQKTEGLNSMAKLNSSRGLTGSGAEMEANAKFLGELGAKEGDRALNQAQVDASRYDNYAQNEATRRYNMGNDQWSRLMDVMNYQQKNSPYASAVDGMNNYGNLGIDIGKMDAKTIADLYQRVRSSGGGGGTPFIPPNPTSADHTMSDLYGAMFGAKNNTNYASNILSGLAGLFK